MTSDQRRVLGAIERCRTAALGGHLDVCRDCGHERPSYNSCRNRHCPKCQALTQARWIARRMQRLLPVAYFHVVFTLPGQLRPLARRNRRAVFEMLLAAAAQTLLELGQDPNRLGGRLGVTAVLHTWTRELAFHPHVHCIVTGGALAADGDRWVHSKPKYLFPLEVMGALFRGKILGALRRAHRRGLLPIGEDVVDPEAFGALLGRLHRTPWVVYAKRPFGGPDQVLRYLGRYTHRIGLSNDRLVAVERDRVCFRTKAGKAVALPPHEFLHRLLDHVLPKRFVKIRHFGLYAPAHAASSLETARQALACEAAASTRSVMVPDGYASADLLLADWRRLLRLLTGLDLTRCPACGSANLTTRPLPPRACRAPPRPP